MILTAAAALRERMVTAMLNNIHPGLVLILFGIVIMAVPEKLRKVLIIAGPVLAALATINLNVDSSMCIDVVPGVTFQLLRVDRLAKIFMIVFSIASLIGAVYALSSKSRWETGFEAIYAGSSMGAVLCLLYTSDAADDA